MKSSPKVNKYIDPMVDFGFKKIFKESGNKNLIIRPLNAVFGLDIIDITITESEQLGLTEQERKASFDMRCTTKDGKTFLIEVQIADQKYFMERAIFYTARAISSKAEKGDWNYDVGPVFFLGLLNFDIRHLDPERADPLQYIHQFLLREESTRELMSNSLRFAFMEIARFNKPKDECITFEDRFLYIMKNLPTFVEKPKLWDDPYFEDMVQEAEFANMSFAEQEAYIQAMKNRWDYQNAIDYAREEGIVLVAKRMLADNIPIETIVKYTGLTEEQIRAL
jgi:predicted transposase/invertase (TIGR01784 family)